MLGADTHKLPWLHLLQCGQYRRNERPQFLQTIRPCNGHDDRDARSGDVLLELEILINGQKALEARGEHHPEELIVPLTRPPLLYHCADVVPC